MSSPPLRWHRLVALVAVSLLALGSSAARATPDPPELAGLTSIHADGSRSGLVEVPSDATISMELENNSSVAITGTREFVGVVLVSIDRDDPHGTILMINRLPGDAYCAGDDCAVTTIDDVFVEHRQVAGHEVGVIPAGTYRMYVTTEEQASVTVALRLGDLTGAVDVMLTDPSDPIIERHDQASTDSSPLLVDGGAHALGAREGIAMAFLWVKAMVDVAGVGNYDFSEGGQDDGIPTCPTCELHLQAQYTVTDSTPATVLLTGYVAPFYGSLAQQVDLESVRVTDRVGTLLLWLPLVDKITGWGGYGIDLRHSMNPLVPSRASRQPSHGAPQRRAFVYDTSVGAALTDRWIARRRA